MGETVADEAVREPNPRFLRRGTPRLTTTMAAAGAFVAFSGAMVIAFDATEGDGDGGVSTVPGMLISLGVVIAGYVLLAIQKRGPLATAGLVAFAVALPFFLGYATFDENSLPPISITTVLGLSAVGWGLAYGIGASRGRPFLLGAALLAAWLFVLEQITEVFNSPFALAETFMLAPFVPSDEGFEDFGSFGPDPTEVALVCGFVAAAYLVASFVLERRGHAGAATPMVAIGHVAAIVAIFTVADDLQEIGTGLAAVVVGVLLLYRGAATERRATTWIGGIYLVGGFQAIVTGITDSATGGGVLLIGAGAIVAVVAAFIAGATDEPDDTELGPSFPDGIRRRAAPEPAEGPLGPGWWVASDGNWYPPEQHPDAQPK